MENKTMGFPDHIRAKYRVVITRYGNGEFEESIPLGSWRKGGGLAGKKGHVYVKGEREAGIWLISGCICNKAAKLLAEVPSLTVMQCGDGEATMSVPWSDLELVLPLIGAKKVRIGRSPSDSSREAIAKVNEARSLAKNTSKKGVE